MTKPLKWTMERRDEVLALYESGTSKDDLGRRFDATAKAIERVIHDTRALKGLCGDPWHRRVHALMREGLGVEDIAVEIGCPVRFVRTEADILRATGALDELYRHYRTARPGWLYTGRRA